MSKGSILPLCQPCFARGELVAATYRCTEHHVDLCDACTGAHVAEDAEGVDA